MPDRMKVDRDDNGQICYEYFVSDSDAGTERQGRVKLNGSDVLHIPGLGFDGLVGYSPIAMAKLSSAVGFKGICRKVLIFLLLGIANIIDINAPGSHAILRTVVIFFYISNEGISLLENSAHLGLPIPGKLKAVLKQLHDKAESEEEGGSHEI